MWDYHQWKNLRKAKSLSMSWIKSVNVMKCAFSLTPGKSMSDAGPIPTELSHPHFIHIKGGRWPRSPSHAPSAHHSLSEQMTPAEKRAAAFWQLTALWRWQRLSAISSPEHFTPLITISVTLLLSQYHVSLTTSNKHRWVREDVERYACMYGGKWVWIFSFLPGQF